MADLNIFAKMNHELAINRVNIALSPLPYGGGTTSA